jgi:Glycosyl hydrolase family 99
VRRLRWTLLPLCVLLAAPVTQGSALAASSTCASGKLPSLNVHSVPALAGVRVRVDGQTVETNARGAATVAFSTCGTHTLSASAPRTMPAGTRATFARWVDDVFTRSRTIFVSRPVELQVGFNVDYRVRESFVDRHGHPVPQSHIERVVQSNSLGSKERFKPGSPRWLAGTRIIRRSFGLQPTEVLYSVRDVLIDGTNVVRVAKERFKPKWSHHHVEIPLLLYSLNLRAKDRLFGFPLGSGIRLTSPNGHVRVVHFRDGAHVYINSLPRGTYDVSVMTHGVNTGVPIALTRDQTVTLDIVSYLDVAVFLGLLAAAAAFLLLVRRPGLRARVHPRVLLRRVGRASGGAAVLIGCLLLLGHVTSANAAATRPPRNPEPVLAYYYIWYTHGSWDRAKIDYPRLGRYSSDQAKVMRQQITWAKSAGINGFIVSWKSTPMLNRNLRVLVRVARQEHFKLAIIYQGLNFEREPLHVSRVRADLVRFARTYGDNPVFDIFGKPLVVWSGTWRFAPRDIASVSRAVRPRVLLLASQKSQEDYSEVARLFDGDAYYWSSVNPSTYPDYPQKLISMAATVHNHGGLWIAPAAPGFNAHLIGGTSTVPRAHGQTFRQEMDGALQSSPDAVGVISWNEFSENSEIEPTLHHGSASLGVLADMLGTHFSSRTDFDSSDPPSSTFGYGSTLAAGLGFVAFTVLLGFLWRKGIRNASRT